MTSIFSNQYFVKYCENCKIVQNFSTQLSLLYLRDDTIIAEHFVRVCVCVCAHARMYTQPLSIIILLHIHARARARAHTHTHTHTSQK